MCVGMRLNNILLFHQLLVIKYLEVAFIHWPIPMHFVNTKCFHLVMPSAMQTAQIRNSLAWDSQLISGRAPSGTKYACMFLRLPPQHFVIKEVLLYFFQHFSLVTYLVQRVDRETKTSRHNGPHWEYYPYNLCSRQLKCDWRAVALM